MRVVMNVNEFEVTQRNMSSSTLHISVETNDGDIELYMNAKQIQHFINETQEKLNRYKKQTHIE